MSRHTMLIDGAATATAKTFPVLDPATQQECGAAPACDLDQLDLAVAAATRALPEWQADEQRRRQALRGAAERLEGAAGALAPLLTAEQGKPLGEAESEVRATAFWLRAYADLPLPADEVREGDDGATVTIGQRPLGVVAAITPWNYPLLIASWKLAPALLTGNTVVLKPSPYTPLSTLEMGALLAAELPPGVLNVLSGGDELGAWLVAHAGVRKVSFTGSVAAGRQVASAAAADFKRVTLELGGNDAAIVLDDCEPAQAARDLFWYAFHNCGQTCAAIKRLYVPRPLLGELSAALVELAQAVVVGPGTEPGVQIGPLTTRPQFEHVAGLVEDAVRGGATVLSGGQPLDSPGNFYPPTLLVDAGDDSRVVAEEQFGPVLPLLAYDSLEEAVARANATRFGLCGSAWGSDPERAQAVAAQLECGSAYVNRHGEIFPDTPFGGVKDSGIGVEGGDAGLSAYLDVRVTQVAAPGP
jgi:acyl-CoA reductase-like NAD-dependent aldehyde dehydrogenase